MFIEFHAIDWWLVIFNFVWILGAAIILSDFSYHEFLTKGKEIKLTDILKKSSFKKPLFAGVILLSIGIVFSSINSKNDYLLIRFTYIDYNIYDPAKIEKYDIGKLLNIPTHGMEVKNKKYRVSNNLIAMSWNGYVETPFIKFTCGHYALEFEAFGSEANNEFSKIVVALLVIKDKKLVLHNFIKIIGLTELKKGYRLKFEVEESKTGKIRVRFFNDFVGKKGNDRNVWIGGMKIEKLK